MTDDSTLIAHEPCPKCGSRDNLARYSDGHGYCFGCSHYEHGDGQPTKQRAPVRKDLLPLGEYRALPRRKITQETCEKFGYHIYNGQQIANYRDPTTGELVAQKVRGADKSFYVVGDLKQGGLYGQHLWRSGGRKVIITEGEIDALSVSQVQDNKWPVVSLPNGASGARKALAAQLDWLNGFEQVVLCFDQDDPGREAVRDCATLFAPGKLFTVHLPLKDASDMLQADRSDELLRCLWEAKGYRPDGIVTLSDIRDRVLRDPEQGLEWCLPTLNEQTYGRRYGECVGLGAGTGIGKTTLLTQQIAYDITVLKQAVAVFAFEQHPAETAKRVAGQIAGKPFHIPDAGWTYEELDDTLERINKGAGLFLYDHFGSCDWQHVRERMRYLRHVHGVRLFYLDHLTALAAAEDDERKGLEKIMSDLGSLVKELDCWVLFVSHLSTPEGKSHEEGGRVTIKHFKGSRAIGYWSHFMIGLERDQQSDDRDERGRTILRVLKDRYTGRATGLTLPLVYDQKSGLLKEADDTAFGDEDTDTF